MSSPQYGSDRHGSFGGTILLSVVATKPTTSPAPASGASNATLEAAIGQADRTNRFIECVLSRLSPNESHDLAQVLGVDTYEGDLPAEAEGNPLVIRWPAGGHRGHDVGRFVRSATADLTASERTALQLFGLYGRPLSRARFGSLSATANESARLRVRLCERGILTGATDQIEFACALVREQVVDEIPGALRSELHGRLGHFVSRATWRDIRAHTPTNERLARADADFGLGRCLILKPVECPERYEGQDLVVRATRTYPAEQDIERLGEAAESRNALIQIELIDAWEQAAELVPESHRGSAAVRHRRAWNRQFVFPDCEYVLAGIDSLTDAIHDDTPEWVRLAADAAEHRTRFLHGDDTAAQRLEARCPAAAHRMAQHAKLFARSGELNLTALIRRLQDHPAPADPRPLPPAYDSASSSRSEIPPGPSRNSDGRPSRECRA